MKFVFRKKLAEEENLLQGIMSLLGVVGIDVLAYALGQIRIHIWYKEQLNILFEA